MPRPLPSNTDTTELRELYRMEKELADRLRSASAEERPSLYGEVYDQYFSSLPKTDSDPAGSEQTLLQKHLIAPFLAPSTVFLEVGSGDGALARSLAPETREVWTVEASTVVAPAQLPENFHHVPPQEAEDRVPPSGIDLAFSCHFVEHLHPDDLLPHLRQILRWLKPGAPYVSVTPNRLHGPHDVSGFFSDVPRGFHLREYGFSDLADAFQTAGFAKVEALLGVGKDPVRWPILPIRGIEGLLKLSGAGFRRLLFDRWLGNRAPLRPLEQVKIIGWKEA